MCFLEQIYIVLNYMIGGLGDGDEFPLSETVWGIIFSTLVCFIYLTAGYYIFKFIKKLWQLFSKYFAEHWQAQVYYSDLIIKK